jgi:hypothetical protein
VEESNRLSPCTVLCAVWAGLGVATVLITQVLSLFHVLTTIGVIIAWALVLVAVTIALAFHPRYSQHSFARILTFCKTYLFSLSLVERVLLIAIMFCCCGTLASALLYPVNNFDGLAHIMPRVFFWIQNRSVAPFPATYGQQLTTYPFAAYAITNLKLLCFGSDILVNTVQWCAYLVSVFHVYFLARLLGAGRIARLFGALTAATIPMTLLQATTIQYDLVAASYMLGATHELAMLWQLRKTADWHLRWQHAAVLGALSGLGLLTKITFLLVMWPFFGSFLIALLVRSVRYRRSAAALIDSDNAGTLSDSCGSRFKKFRHARQLMTIALFGAPFLLVTAGWFGSNTYYYGGDAFAARVEGNAHVLVTDWHPRLLLTNAIRSLGMELSTPVSTVNELIASKMKSAATTVGIDLDTTVNMENPRAYALNVEITNHDMAGAPVTVALIVVGVVAACFTKGEFRHRFLGFTVLTLIGMVTIATLVTWQPFITRTLVGPMMMLSVMVGCTVDGLGAQMSAGNKTDVGTRSPGKPRLVVVRTVRVLAWGLLGVSTALGGLVIVFNSQAPLISQALRPGSAGRDLGWWNRTQHELLTEMLTPELTPVVEWLDAPKNVSGIRVVGLAGDAIAGQPLYPLLEAVSRSGTDGRKPQVVVLPEATVAGSERFGYVGTQVDGSIADVPDMLIFFSSNELSETRVGEVRYSSAYCEHFPGMGCWVTILRRAG